MVRCFRAEILLFWKEIFLYLIRLFAESSALFMIKGDKFELNAVLSIGNYMRAGENKVSRDENATSVLLRGGLGVELFCNDSTDEVMGSKIHLVSLDSFYPFVHVDSLLGELLFKVTCISFEFLCRVHTGAHCNLIFLIYPRS